MNDTKRAPLSLGSNIAWNAFGSIVYLGCQWMTTVLVVVLSAGYENSGIYAFAMSMGNIFSTIGLFSIRAFQVSDVESEYSQQNYIGFRFITVAAGAVFSIIYLACITQEVNYIVATLCILLPNADACFVDVLYGIEQVNGRMDYIGRSQLIRGPLSLLLFCIPLWLTDSLPLAILCLYLSFVGTTILYDVPHARLFTEVKGMISAKTAFRLAGTCIFAVVAGLLAGLIVSASRQSFGLSFGEEQLGIYACIATPAVLIQVAASYLYSPILGTLGEKWHEGRAVFLRIVGKTLGILFVVVVVLVIGLTLVGPFALELVYGESINPYAGICFFVFVATGCLGVFSFTNAVMVVQRSMVLLLVGNALAFAVAAIGIYLFIPEMGMNGVNVTIIAATAVGIVFDLVCITLKKSGQSKEIANV